MFLKIFSACCSSLPILYSWFGDDVLFYWLFSILNKIDFGVDLLNSIFCIVMGKCPDTFAIFSCCTAPSFFRLLSELFVVLM